MNRHTPIHRVAQRDYWYIATPYSKYAKGHEMAYRHACEAAGWLAVRHLNVFCPIAHSHPLTTFGGCPSTDHNFWMRVDGPLMDHACGLIIVEMPGWRESKGIAEEIKTFTAAGKPIYYLRWPLRGQSFEWHKAPADEPKCAAI
jgi:hypothetical protein